jgi:hypothetical protein
VCGTKVLQIKELLAHRALNPPPSSSLAEERTPPLARPPCAGAITDARSSRSAGANSSALRVSRAESGYGARQPPPRA